MQVKQRKASKARLWEDLSYRPNAAQVALHASGARHRVNVAGRRTGKSVGGGREIMPQAIRARHLAPTLAELGIRMEGWIVGPNYTDSEKEFRVFFNDCKRLGIPFDKPGTYYDPKGVMSVSLWDGAFILHGRSGAHPESLVGEGLFFAVMAEAAKLKQTVWERFVRPTLADFNGISIWDTTPEGKNWFYELYKAGQDPKETDWWSARHPSWVNRHVFRKETTPEGVQRMKMMLQNRSSYDHHDFKKIAVDPEIISMAMDLTPEAFSQEVEASFTEYVGRVYKDWDSDLHITDLPYNPSWPLYIATDYGYTHPNVALFIQPGPHGEIHVIAEYWRTHRTDTEFAEDVLLDNRLSRLVQHAIGLYPDPEDPGASATLSERWRVPVLGGTGGELKPRIEAIQQKLKPRNPHLPWGHPERQPWLLADRTCEHLAFEMDAYRWPQTQGEARGGSKGPQRPLDKDDHAPEALSRFFAGHGLLKNGKTILGTAQMHKPVRRRRR
jgi:hypothetical protein